MERAGEESSERSDNAGPLNSRLQLLKTKSQNNVGDFIRLLDEDLPDLPAHLQNLAPRTTRPENRTDLDMASVHLLADFAHKPLAKFYRHFNKGTSPLEVFASVYLRTIYHAGEDYFGNEILGQEHMELLENELEPRSEAEYLLSASVLRVILARAPESSRHKILNLRIVAKMFFKIVTSDREDVVGALNDLFEDFDLSKGLEESYSKWKDFFQNLGKTARVSDAVSSINGILDSWSQGVLSIEEFIMGEIVNHLCIDYFIKFDECGEEQKEFLTNFLQVKEVDDQLKYDAKYVKILMDFLKVILVYLFRAVKSFSRKEKDKGNYIMFQSQLLRTQAMFMVLYNLNSTWYRWFDHFSAPLLVENNDFLCHEIIKEYDKDMLSTEPKVDSSKFLPLYSDMAVRCPFVLPYRIRKTIFDKTVRSVWNSSFESLMLYKISRNNALNEFKYFVDMPRSGRPEKWQFDFENESGTGPGPTREAYTLMSRELQRSHLDIWFDERSFPGENRDNEFAYSSTGLYPKPGDRKEFLIFISLMTRALLDDAFLDIHLNIEFYRTMTLCNLTPFEFRYHQVPQILPRSSSLIEQLLTVKRKKSAILNDASLTKESKHSLIEKLDFKEGCSFDDLSINFTIPGTDIELMDGGKNVMLTPLNLGDYLERLGEKVIHKDIYLSIESAFQTFGTIHDFSMFLPEELESLVCGSRLEPWTVDGLKSTLNFTNGFTTESMAVQYFLEVLASFNTDEQRLFLQFVTGRTRLPCGGFANLKPGLTVSRDNSSDGGRDRDKRLPSVSTCLNTIGLPDYSSLEVVKERLTYAMNECKSFLFI